jgi:hypothetical protein
MAIFREKNTSASSPKLIKFSYSADTRHTHSFYNTRANQRLRVHRDWHGSRTIRVAGGDAGMIPSSIGIFQ